MVRSLTMRGPSAAAVAAFRNRRRLRSKRILISRLPARRHPARFRAYALPLHRATASKLRRNCRQLYTPRNACITRSIACHGSRMKPAPFRYHAPRTVEEAVALLAKVAPQDGRVLAGGQSLVPIMAFRLSKPAHLVDINGVDALRRLAVEGDRLCIGACVRHAAFHRPVVEG